MRIVQARKATLQGSVNSLTGSPMPGIQARVAGSTNPGAVTDNSGQFSLEVESAEAFGCYRHPESARYARIARSSEFETHNHLGDGVDRRYWSSREAKKRQALADRAIGAVTRWLQYLMETDAPDWPKRKDD